jgi:hypothetical protein
MTSAETTPVKAERVGASPPPACPSGCTAGKDAHGRYCHCQSCGETAVDLDDDGYCQPCGETAGLDDDAYCQVYRP